MMSVLRRSQRPRRSPSYASCDGEEPSRPLSAVLSSVYTKEGNPSEIRSLTPVPDEIR